MNELLEIKPCDPGWPRQFETERGRLAVAVGEFIIRVVSQALAQGYPRDL